VSDLDPSASAEPESIDPARGRNAVAGGSPAGSVSPLSADKEGRYLAIIARLIDIARTQHHTIETLMDELAARA
jgi:hypothetical protein